MSKTYNSPQTFEEFVSNPNSYTHVKISYIPSVSGMVLGEEQTIMIAEMLETNKTVTKLTYFSHSTEDKVPAAFGKMLANNNIIIELHFQSKTSIAGGEKLAEGIKKNTSIKKLSLAYYNIGDDVIKAIALALEHHKTISSISFIYQKLTDYQLSTITNSLKNNKTITDFSIYDKIATDDIQHIYDMLNSNPRIITGTLCLDPTKEMQESEEASFSSAIESCKEKLKYNLEKLKKLAKFVNDNLESFTGKFDPTSNPEHPSALKFYQQSNKDSLSERLKLINKDINPEEVFRQLDSYVKYNLFSLTGVFKTPQPENKTDTKGLFSLNEDVMSVIGEHLDFGDIAN